MALNPIETWKAQKHGFDVWPDFLQWSQAATSYSKIAEDDLQRLKWYGVFWRKHDHDRYMLRVRIPACEMTAAQARALAFAAYEAGHEIIDITTRGNIQIQGLTIEKIPKVIAALERTGLTTRQTGLDNIRNVTSHPLAGLVPAELIDTREAARAVTALFVGDRELADLPRKFNISFNGRADNAPPDWTQDISLLAARRFRGLNWLSPSDRRDAGPDTVPRMASAGIHIIRKQVCGVVLSILRLFHDRGSRNARRNRVRFRFLVEELGLDQILGEIERRSGYTLQRFAEPPPPARSHREFHRMVSANSAGSMGGWHRGSDGTANLAAIRRYRDPCARLWRRHDSHRAYDQNLVLPGISGRKRAAMGGALASLGLSLAADSLTRQIIACTGRQFCNLALTEARGHGLQMIEDLRRRHVELYGIRAAIADAPTPAPASHGRHRPARSARASGLTGG